MILDDLAIFVDAGTTALTAGTNLFKGNFPPTTVDTCVAIYESGSLPPVWAFGATAPTYERVRVQIVSRSSKYQTARNNAETVYKLLDHVANSTVVSSTGPRYLQINAVQSPFYIGPDERNRPQMSCNFDIWKEIS